ncbi:Predicted metal-dependent hydrolase, TIM-barrel fold [Collimonas sp. OK607]|uniref:amidohydrolase family protein n=1 Tax=Collimonas sp. OK607 TaxID=1798194 RepID=UPI0008EF6A17|nr:amidohydrolase family protein [Collimonas sp. OK607]SFA68742.1 Predicted metal-dependent hydrolase, TIM-barrel fold [Collimonas sp. OK607]
MDTHAHIFKRGLTLANVRRYAPNHDAPLETYLATLDQHGIARGILVQPSFLGTDNSFMLAALRQVPARLRGIAVVDPTISSVELDALNVAGVVGVRLNLVGAPLPDFSSCVWSDFLKHVARLGWQVELHREARDLPLILPPLLRSGVNVVVDHFGRPDPTLGVNDLGFRYLLDTAASRRVWVKLSAAYRNGANGAGEQTALAAIPLLRNAFGAERLMWGSDWPHTQFEKSTNYDQVRTLLDSWLPDPEERRVVLVDTPSDLFRFL